MGQVAFQAITKIKSIDNAKLIAELHSGDTFQSVQGPVKFDATGQNTYGPGIPVSVAKGNVHACVSHLICTGNTGISQAELALIRNHENE